jgi:uncharacterized protein (DUF2249 family)
MIAPEVAPVDSCVQEPGAKAWASAGEVDLYQGSESGSTGRLGLANTLYPPTNLAMPPLSRFKKLDVRPVLAKGREPLPEILKRVAQLKSGEGLIVVAPFLPSPLIEKLGSEGFESKLEPGANGDWIVYFWRHNENQSPS